MAKYIKVDVVRSQDSCLYLKVPDDWDNTVHLFSAVYPHINAAVETTLDEYDDWDFSYPHYDVNGAEWVSEEEAAQYRVYEVTE